MSLQNNVDSGIMATFDKKFFGSHMRRSICFCEPTFAYAGNRSNWKFSYTTSVNLPEKSHLRFDLLSTGRETDWEIPSADPSESVNIIWGIMPNRQIVHPILIEGESPISSLFEFELPAEIKSGETFTIMMGTMSDKREEISQNGNRAQCYVQRRKPFHLYIDPKAKGDFRDAEIFTMDVKGNALKTIKIITPSLVGKNQRFDVFLRFEDSNGNLTGNAPEGTLIELSYDQLRDNLSWKLFVPETGFLNLPNLYFNEEGVYLIQLYNTLTKERFYSSPIRCASDADKTIFWGTFHGESEKIDCSENIEACLRHFRDEAALNFFASSPFESAEETSNDQWKAVSQHVADFNEDTRFGTFLGFQWIGEEKTEGLRQIIYHKDNKPILRFKDSKSNNLKKIYKGHNPKDFISIPSFTMNPSTAYNFAEFSPEFERVVEIYNAWGSSECLAKEGNPRPIAVHDEKSHEYAEGSIRKALNNNYRFGFVAGGLDDRGVFEDFYDSDQVQYSPGLTAVVAPAHSREALFQALYNRACYATTGARIVLDFAIAHCQMGSELSNEVKPGLAFNRHITVFVAAVDQIEKIEIIRNGSVIHTIHPKTKHHSFAFDDTTPLKQVSLKTGDEDKLFSYYYVRVTQVDGHMAWSSPIWVDFIESKNASVKKAKALPKKKSSLLDEI